MGRTLLLLNFSFLNTQVTGNWTCFLNFGEVVSVFKGTHKFNRNNGSGKGHAKIFPTEGSPAILPRKIIFRDSITSVVLFAENVV